MSSIALVVAAHHPQPILGRVGVIAVGAASTVTDLTTITQINAHLAGGELLTFQADADVYVAFNNAYSGAVVIAATSGATSCFRLVAGVAYTFQFCKGYTFLVSIAPVATVVRVYMSGVNDTRLVGT